MILKLINRTLIDISRSGQFNPIRFMDSLVSIFGYNGGALFEAHSERYKCLYVNGIQFTDRYGLHEHYTNSELPVHRHDVYLKDAPIAVLLCDPFDPWLLDQLSPILSLSLSMSRVHEQNKNLIVANLETCHDSLEFITRAVMNRQFVAAGKDTAIMTGMSHHIGRAMRNIRELREYSLSERSLVNVKTHIKNLVCESLEMTDHPRTNILMTGPVLIQIDSHVLQRSILVPLFQRYPLGSILRIQIDTQNGFTIISIFGTTPMILMDIDRCTNLGLVLARRICVSNGGHFHSKDQNRFECSMPIQPHHEK